MPCPPTVSPNYSKTFALSLYPTLILRTEASIRKTPAFITLALTELRLRISQLKQGSRWFRYRLPVSCTSPKAISRCFCLQPCGNYLYNMTPNLTPLGRRTLRDKAAQAAHYHVMRHHHRAL